MSMEPGTLKALTWAKRIAYSSEETVMFSYEQAVKYKDSPGVYVECGVATGAQIIAMAAGAPTKTIYAFDSFEGIPLPSNRDDQMPGIRWLTKEEQKALPNPGEQILKSSGATIVSEIIFMDNIKASGVSYDNLIFIKGWFEETLPKIEKLDISILRLDGDLYNSTYVCLKYLYPKVIKGGIVIIDDWGLPGCRQAVMDYFEEMPEIQFVSNIAYWIK